jgi:hypothetical protein
MKALLQKLTGANKTILIVEDEENNILYLQVITREHRSIDTYSKKGDCQSIG